MAKLSTILDQIDAGSMLLPEFQRGYVWNRDQVRGFDATHGDVPAPVIVDQPACNSRANCAQSQESHPHGADCGRLAAAVAFRA